MPGPGPADAAPDRGALRLLTCGSVDDGKSSLIGRLLIDCALVPDDQLAALERDSRRFGTNAGGLDPALLLDGLEDERAQGITIDVAYRYIALPGRRLIVADAPGHEQYTRNMATAASTSELALILVDARRGILPQTRRHSIICALFGIRQVVLAVNKIDLVGYDGAVFEAIAAEYRALAEILDLAVTAIPLSARVGDNIVTRSPRTPWYAGPTLVAHLTEVEVPSAAAAALRFPVQWINRPGPDFRGVAGTLASGTIAVGDLVVVAASGAGTRIREIVTFEGNRASAQAGDAVTLVLEDALDIARGDLLSAASDRPELADQFTARILWMNEEPLFPGRPFLLKIGGGTRTVTVTALRHRLDPVTLEQLAGDQLALNEIGVCNLSSHAAIAFDPFAVNRATGAFILIDRLTCQTVGAGMILHGLRRAHNIHRQALTIGKAERALIKRQNPAVLWFTGFSGAGKSTIADHVEQALHADGYHTALLDGDNIRHGLNRDLGFTEADRIENIRRVGEVAKLMSEAGLIVLCSFISPFRAERQMVRELMNPGEFLEIFVDTPLAECRRRDPKGLYAKALAGGISNFTGVDQPYEAPLDPEIRLATVDATPQESAAEVLAELARRNLFVR